MKFVRQMSVVALAAALATFWSCGGKAPAEATNPAAPVAAAPAEGGDDEAAASATFSSMRWRVVDRCPDGRGLQFRLFDRTGVAGKVFPENGGTYKAISGRAADKVIVCRTNNRICPGITTTPRTPLYWGVGVNGDKKCLNCCKLCGPKSIYVELSCPNKKPSIYIQGAQEDELSAEAEGSIEFADDSEAVDSF